MADPRPVDPPPLPPVNDEPPGDPEITRGPPPDTVPNLSGFPTLVAIQERALAGPATSQRALDWLRARLGMGESPPGSNCNEITRAFGIGCVPWCAETSSFAVNHAWGDEGHWPLDVPSDYTHGTAFVPNWRTYFIGAGLYSDTPSIGAAAICVWGPGFPIGDHIGLVESWVDTAGNQRTDAFDASASDGTVVMLDGNFNNDLVRIRRSMSLIDGYCLIPYESEEDDDMADHADQLQRIEDNVKNLGRIFHHLGDGNWEIGADRVARAVEKIERLPETGDGSIAGIVEVTGTLRVTPKK